MSCVIEDVTDAEAAATQHDQALGALLLKHEGSTQALLASVFGFLGRKTNFYKTGDPRRKVLDAYREASGDTGGLKAGFLGSSKPAPTPAPAAASAAPEAAPATTSSAPAAPAPPSEPAAAEAAASEPSVLDLGAEPEEEEEDAKPKGLKPNAGRGADLGHYSWTQSLSEVSVLVPVPPGTKARQLSVVVGKQKLHVGLKGEPPIIDGLLSEAVKPDDSLWNLADNTVELTLAKAEGMHWWRSVMEGDPTIDVQAVEPENSKLTDLDPETRSTVEKMMFDQRQKALGRPTSDEMQKQEMLKKFMAAHPEMDFSQAKIM